jgi:acyl-CoA thioesterase
MSEQLDPACEGLGIVADEIVPGRAVLRMKVTEAMVNVHGIAHGGFLFLLADAAFAYAVNTGRPVTVAQSAQVTYLRPAYVGDELVAEAVERVAFGRGGITDVTVRASDGSVVAEFRGQSQTLSGRPQSPASEKGPE